jgi:hypothetical protein
MLNKSPLVRNQYWNYGCESRVEAENARLPRQLQGTVRTSYPRLFECFVRSFGAANFS